MWLTRGRFTIEIIRFFGYPKSAVYDIVQKNANAKSVKVSANPQGKTIRMKRLQGPQVSSKELKNSFRNRSPWASEIPCAALRNTRLLRLSYEAAEVKRVAFIHRNTKPRFAW